MPINEITREIFWNIPAPARTGFYVLSVLTFGIFIYGVLRNVNKVLKAKDSTISWQKLRTGIMRTTAEILLNRTVGRAHRLAGLMHFGLMWGFIALFIGTIIIAIEFDIFEKLLGRSFWVGSFFLGYEIVLDAMGSFFLLGLIGMLIRRYGFRRPQLTWKPIDFLLPGSLLLIGITGFAVEGMRLAATLSDLPYSPYWSPVGFAVAYAWRRIDVSTTRAWHMYAWWLHGLSALGFVAALPYSSKVTHILYAAVNMLLRDVTTAKRLTTVDVEDAFAHDRSLGISTTADLTRKDILDLISCTECGRCEMNCPAHISGKVLSPRQIVIKLRDQFAHESSRFYKSAEKKNIVDDLIKTQELWSCTTCTACVEACPVYIDPLSKILELRRSEVMIQDRYPETFADVFTGTSKRGNPWNRHPTSRLEWADGLPIRTMAQVKEAGETMDCLLWVGCSAAFDPRNQRIVRSLVQVLNEAGVSFAVLGNEETCTGDPVRRMGHEYLYQIQARKNVETLQSYSFRRIVTLCPHCYQSLGKEYTDLGGNYAVVHHTQLIHELLQAGRLRLTTRLQGVVTYHDSCYLGRYNGVYDAPREILKQIQGLEIVEMTKNRDTAMCCGAGGGMMWIEEEQGKRINERRVDQVHEAIGRLPATEERSRIVASACPFCMTMMEDGLASRKSDVQDRDIVELVAEAIRLQPTSEEAAGKK